MKHLYQFLDLSTIPVDNFVDEARHPRARSGYVSAANELAKKRTILKYCVFSIRYRCCIGIGHLSGWSRCLFRLRGRLSVHKKRHTRALVLAKGQDKRGYQSRQPGPGTDRAPPGRRQTDALGVAGGRP